MDLYSCRICQAFASASFTHFKRVPHKFSTHVRPLKLQPAEIVTVPSRRVRKGVSVICSVADGSSQTPNSHPFSSTSSASSTASFDLLYEALRDEGSKQQALAFVAVTRMPSQLALKLLEKSGVLNSRFRKTRVSALNVLGTLKIINQSIYLAEVLEKDPDYSIRAAAAGALSYILDEGNTLLSSAQTGGKSNLKGSGSDDTNVGLQSTANEISDTVDDEECLKLAARALRKAATDDDHFLVRYSSIVALGTLRDVASVDLLLPLIQTFATPTLEAAAAIDALGEILRPKDVSAKVLSAVRARATDTDDLIRAAVARTFDAWRAIPEAAENLPAMLRNEVKFGRSSFVLGLLHKLIARGGNA